MSRTNNFFAGKREWSKIKDSILEDYMSQYTAKLNALGRPLVLIDGFAGQGVFLRMEVLGPHLLYVKLLRNMRKETIKLY